jgi:hypothetical protein
MAFSSGAYRIVQPSPSTVIAMSFDWRKFLLGAGLAALATSLHAAEALPAPYGAIATAAVVLLASFAPSALGPKAPSAGVV